MPRFTRHRGPLCCAWLSINTGLMVRYLWCTSTSLCVLIEFMMINPTIKQGISVCLSVCLSLTPISREPLTQSTSQLPGLLLTMRGSAVSNLVQFGQASRSTWICINLELTVNVAMYTSALWAHGSAIWSWARTRSLTRDLNGEQT